MALRKPCGKLDKFLGFQDVDKRGRRDARRVEIAPRIREGGSRQLGSGIKKIGQKCVPGLSAQAVLPQLLFREITKIPGEDDGRAAGSFGSGKVTAPMCSS